MASIRPWHALTQAFLEQYSFNLDQIPKREDLVTTVQRPHETFREYVGRWRALASQVRDRPSDEESIETLIRGAQPSIGGLLSIQPITTFASLIRAGARVESSLRSGCYLALIAFAGQDTAPGNNNHNHSNSNNNNGNNSNHSRRRDHPKPAVAFIGSPAALFNVVG